jgi:hypothetical protein
MPLLYCAAKHLYYIPPVLVVWRRTASQTGAFATATRVFQMFSLPFCIRHWPVIADTSPLSQSVTANTLHQELFYFFFINTTSKMFKIIAVDFK